MQNLLCWVEVRTQTQSYNQARTSTAGREYFCICNMALYIQRTLHKREAVSQCGEAGASLSQQRLDAASHLRGRQSPICLAVVRPEQCQSSPRGRLPDAT